MASDAVSGTKDGRSKPHGIKQSQQDEQWRCRSVFEVAQDFFDSCLLLNFPFSSLPDFDVSRLSLVESKSEEKSFGNEFSGFNSINNNDYCGDAKAMEKWSCNTCKLEFESLEDQRLHFKSDLHRFNIKLTVAGKKHIKEDDFDETISDTLCEDYDISSISGSEDEDDRENGTLNDRQHGFRGILKNKVFIQLRTGERVSVWKCLILNDSENIQCGNDKGLGRDGGNTSTLTHKGVIEKLKYIVHEPRDNTHLRIVLLARGGHFAGCVLDGNTLVAHKTFHRYVVRAKSGKKQSSKDASGRGIHSAGASLRRYNELALKKDIQELITSWKHHFANAYCIFIHAPSNNREIFYDGEKPYFKCAHHVIRNIPMTVRRPTFKEAMRVYGLLMQISLERSEETTIDTTVDQLTGVNFGNETSNGIELTENFELEEKPKDGSVVSEIDGFSLPLETNRENDIVGTSTPLHVAAKLGNTQKVLELLEHGLDPCLKDERGRTAYLLADDKEVRNTFRRFMALNLEKWDWQAAHVPSALTKEMEEAQAAKQAEKDAKRKARAKELKKQRKAKEKKAQAEAAQSQSASDVSRNFTRPSSNTATVTKEEERIRTEAGDREKRAAAAERRIAAAAAEAAGSSNAPTGSHVMCSCCSGSLAGKVPFHRYRYKYCSTTCMQVHGDMLEDR